MDHPRYHRLKNRELSLTDYLAIDRTVLANERTALAFARTVLALVVVGGSCIKLFDAWYMLAIGVIFLILALVTAWMGWQRYHRTRRQLNAALELDHSDPSGTVN